jgi:hypothetical protein
MRKLKSFVRSHFEGAIIVFIFLGVFAIVFLVRNKFSFLHFFFFPVILSGYFLGKKKAVLAGIFCVLIVVLYFIFFSLYFNQQVQLNFDEIIILLTWGSFLILTGGVIGSFSEQREGRIKNMRRAYIGVLDIMLKYLEVADEKKPRSLRVSDLSGNIARAEGLSTSEVENIKSAALLYEAGDLRSSLYLFEDVADFIKSDIKVHETHMVDRERLMLSTTASLLKAIEPILSNYFHHYVREVDRPDKNLDEIPVGSSIIALADLYDRISTQVPVHQGGEEIKSFEDIEKLSDRSFPGSIVQALREVTKTV